MPNENPTASSTDFRIPGKPSQSAPSWIEKTPDVCGGDACIRRTRHTVAGLVQWRKMGLSDDRILHHHPDLTQADLDAAWTYYRQHNSEVDQAIKEGEDVP